MSIKKSVLDHIIYKTVELVWSRENNGRRKILKWCPPGRQGRRRTRNSGVQEVTTGMRGKGIKNLEWIDREGWRRKIKLNFMHRKM